MTRPLILSDAFAKQSDEPQGSFPRGSTRTTPPDRRGHAAGRARDARNAAGRLQALRPAKLPLCQWAWTWPEALSLGQSKGRPPAPRLCAQYRRRSRRSIHQQLARYTRCARRDLRHQHRASATPRGAWIDRHESRARPVRLDPGGRHSCRHGHGLSRRRPAARCGGEAR